MKLIPMGQEFPLASDIEQPPVSAAENSDGLAPPIWNVALARFGMVPTCIVGMTSPSAPPNPAEPN